MTQGSSGVGVVHLFRKPSYNSILLEMRFEINGVVVGSVKSGGQISVQVPAGRHSARVVGNAPGAHSKPMIFEITPDEQIELVCVPQLRLTNVWDLYRASWRSSAPLAPTAAARPSGTVSTAKIVGVRSVEVVETGRSEEPLGEETRTVDNRGSDTAVTRAVKAGREWSRTLTIGYEQARTLSGELTAGPGWLSVKGRIETALTRNYSTETSTRESMAEEIQISVPAHTSTQLVLAWKRIWQHGVVKVTFENGWLTEVPFQVVVGVTFDQSQRDSH